MSDEPELLKITVKFAGVQANQLTTIMEKDGFTTYSETIRAAVRYYYENHTMKKINKPLDNGDKNEDTLDIRDK